MTFPKLPALFCLILSTFASAQTPPPSPATPKKVDKAAAYYHFSLGHLYAELAAAYGSKGDYLSKAIENYRLAMKADPGASFLAEQLSDLYVQAGRLREAVSDSEDALKQNPSDVNARRILGRIYTRMVGDSRQGKINQEMLRKAIEQYQKIAEQEPSDIESMLTLARLQKVAQNSLESEKVYKKILDTEPENEDALTGL